MRPMQPISIFTTAGDTSAAPVSRDGVAVSSTNTYYSTPWSGDTYALSLFWTGTPTGTFTMWVSDKPNPDLANDNDWRQDTGFAPTNPAGSASKTGDDVTNSNANLKRIKYVNASGSGTLTGYVTQV